jgi:hypothetical protein
MYYSLAKYHGIFNLPFVWTKRVSKFSRAGCCRYKYDGRKKRRVPESIGLQPVFVEKNLPVVIKWTILHEIAHAMNPSNGHGNLWRESAIIMGHSGKRFYNNKIVKR